ncbi:MAG: hypothetical protein DRP09_17045, partial [Candidatus Thorarchaeota archaeon]
QTAIDAADSLDIIELADGTFTGAGNWDIDYSGKAITIRSQSGDPTRCIIDCQGDSLDPHRGVLFRSEEGILSSLIGVSIVNGYAFDESGHNGSGGGVFVDSLSSPVIVNCIFSGNCAGGHGGGVYCYYSTPTLIGCTVSFRQRCVEHDSRAAVR